MFTVKTPRVCLLVALLLLSGLRVAPAHAQTAAAPAKAEPRPYFYEPAISPDRREIAFVSGGDIWTAPAEGGEARLLVSHPATELRPLYSPDGRRLAFVSTRTGNGDIYVLDFASGEVRRVTFDDGGEQLDAWSHDGKWLYYSSTARDIAASNDVYRVSPDGRDADAGLGRPLRERVGGGARRRTAPTLAFVGRGYVQWWRHGHAHIDESDHHADARTLAHEVRGADRRQRERGVADVGRGRARASSTCPTAAGPRTSGSSRSGAGGPCS